MHRHLGPHKWNTRRNGKRCRERTRATKRPSDQPPPLTDPIDHVGVTIERLRLVGDRQVDRDDIVAEGPLTGDDEVPVPRVGARSRNQHVRRHAQHPTTAGGRTHRSRMSRTTSGCPVSRGRVPQTVNGGARNDRGEAHGRDERDFGQIDTLEDLRSRTLPRARSSWSMRSCRHTSALYTLDPSRNPRPSRVMRSIVIEEMLHSRWRPQPAQRDGRQAPVRLPGHAARISAPPPRTATPPRRWRCCRSDPMRWHS